MKKTIGKIADILLCIALVASLLVICKKPSTGVPSDNGISLYQDSIMRLTALNDSLNAEIGKQEIVYKDRIKVLKVMTPEKQVETFSQNVRIKTDLKDSVAMVPIKGIEVANIKFAKLDLDSTEIQMLKSIISNKNSIIGCYSKEVDTLNVQNKVFKKGLSKQKLINKITYVGAGIVAIIAIIK